MICLTSFPNRESRELHVRLYSASVAACKMEASTNDKTKNVAKKNVLDAAKKFKNTESNRRGGNTLR